MIEVKEENNMKKQVNKQEVDNQQNNRSQVINSKLFQVVCVRHSTKVRNWIPILAPLYNF